MQDLILPVTPAWTKIAVPGMPEYRYTINTAEKQHKQSCKPLSRGFDGQLMEQRSTYRAHFVALDIALALFSSPPPEEIMDQLLTVLAQLGLGVATNAVYDLLKGLGGKTVDPQQVATEIQNRINMCGVSIRAETVISALAQKGLLVIDQSHLHANQSLVFGSTQGKAVFGNNSTMTTNRTGISAGTGAYIETNGNAQVRHNPDGSISFHVGDGKS